MSRRRRRTRRTTRSLPLLVGLVAVVAAIVTPAYASSQSGPAGAGQGVVSGFTVSGIQWQLGEGDALSGVTFQLSPAKLSPASARSVRVRVTAGGSWSSCSVAGGSASCPLPRGTAVADAAALAVVAY